MGNVLNRIVVISALTLLSTACSGGFQSSSTSSNSAASVTTPSVSPQPNLPVTPAPTPLPTPTPSPTPTGGVAAVSANSFLSSLGINTHIAQGNPAQAYVAPLKFIGVRNIRDENNNINSILSVHSQTGVMVDLIGGGGNLSSILANAKTLATGGALLSLEGPNEPNNFTFTYNGQNAGGSGSWLPVAQFQRDFYSSAKSDSVLSKYPMFTVSEEGAETSNVGLQFLTIPTGTNAAMPDGTKYADYANVHNYVSSTKNEYVDNQAWNAADPTLDREWDGLHTEFGLTWNKHYSGYSSAQLQTLPRVTTETGWDSGSNPGGVTVQGKVLVNTYLSQFKRGWKYTFIYELFDGQGSDGAQGVYDPNGNAKAAANYIHNLTSILNDTTEPASLKSLNYSIANEPSTVHDLLLQKANGTFELIVWGENANTSSSVTVNLGSTHAVARIYDVTSGTSPTKSLSNVSQLNLTLTDHALLIELP